MANKSVKRKIREVLYLDEDASDLDVLEEIIRLKEELFQVTTKEAPTPIKHEPVVPWINPNTIQPWVKPKYPGEEPYVLD